MKEILTPKEAERLQNEIWRKMPTAKKIKILHQLFRFMNKIAAQKNKDFREFLKPLYDKTSPLAKELEDVIQSINH